MIKTIVFDLGGVLFEDGKKIALETLSKEYDYDKELVLSVMTCPESVDLRKGLITNEKFWDIAQTKLPKHYDVKIIEEKWYESYKLRETVLDIIKKLKEKFTVVIFSDNTFSRLEYLDNKYSFKKYFDKEIYSCEENMIKKEKEFFKLLLERLNRKSEEVVFIDDNEEFISNAKEFGINTIHYTSLDSLKQGLEELGVI